VLAAKPDSARLQEHGSSLPTALFAQKCCSLQANLEKLKTKGRAQTKFKKKLAEERVKNGQRWMVYYTK
jgi:hypothetical protein